MGNVIVPIGNSEVIKRATALAHLAMEAESGDFTVGFAEGLIDIDGEWYTVVWCVVLTKQEQAGTGGGLLMKLPPELLAKMSSEDLTTEDLEKHLEKLGDSAYTTLVQQALLSLRG